MKFDCILFSPHPDDIALSIGSLAYFLGKHKKTMVVTSFSRSKYYKHRIINKDISKTRIKEDQIFCENIGAKYYSFNLPDRSFMGYSQNFKDVSSDIRFNDLIIKIQKLFKHHNSKFIFVPLSIGRHIDHILLHKTLSDYYRGRILYYLELPYAAIYKNDLKQYCSSFNSFSYTFNNEGMIIRDELIGIYRSQMLNVYSDSIYNYLKKSNNLYVEQIFGNNDNVIKFIRMLNEGLA